MERTSDGHKRIDETMGYVHVAGRHRSLPAELVAAGMKETDPTNRVLAMLGAPALRQERGQDAPGRGSGEEVQAGFRGGEEVQAGLRRRPS
jgi:hypothetical protein